MAHDRQHDHSCAPACGRCKRGQKNQALGRSRSGFSTKIHALCDALGNPLRFILTGGEQHDCTQALALIEGKKSEAVLADKGYDADYIVQAVERDGGNCSDSAEIEPQITTRV